MLTILKLGIFGVVAVIVCAMSSVDNTEVAMLEVTAETYSIDAAQGTRQTLRCRYSIPDTVNGVRVTWFKYQDGTTDSLLLTVVKSPAHEYSRVETGYTERLGGTTDDLWAGHSLTFLSVQLDDDGQYYCTVTSWRLTSALHSEGESPHITLIVQGKLICCIEVPFSTSTVTKEFYASDLVLIVFMCLV